MALKRNDLTHFFPWGMYEWASSSFFIIIETFVFAVYFTEKVAETKLQGETLWGLTLGLSGLIIAFLGPIFGAIADQGGRRKIWLFAFTSLCILSTALLFWVKPFPEYTLLALWLVGLGSIGSELALIFYNAMLPALAPAKKIGLWSGLGWSMGYFGGIICLGLSLCLIYFTHLNEELALPTRLTFLLAALWYFVFSLPIFLFTPQLEKERKPLSTAILRGLSQLKLSINQVLKTPAIFRFLIARMLYIDGLTSLFIFGGIYAGDVFHMNAKEILLFAIALNITAGLGAFLFSFLDDWLGSKQLIVISLFCLILLASLILVVSSVTTFWILSLSLGLFVGPVQASSRSYLAKITPPALQNQFFGLFTFSGKATAFLNPLLISGTIYLTAKTRVGMSTIILFLLIGMLLMLTVPEDRSKSSFV